MNYALHGNVGLPEEVHGLLRAAGGLGASPHFWGALTDHPQTASLRGFANFLNEMAAHDVSGPRVLIGYSLGGRLALHALTQQPQLWDAAILISPHPGLRSDAERRDRLARDKEWAARFRTEPWPGVIAAWNGQEIFRSSTFQCRVECADRALDFGAGEKRRQPEQSGDSRRQTAAGSPTGERSESKSSHLESWREQIARGFDVWSLGRQDDLRPLLPSVACPVLWITGARDEKFTALAGKACALLPRARHVIIPTVGHRVHFDAPDAVAEAVTSFLRDSRTAGDVESVNPVAASGPSS